MVDEVSKISAGAQSHDVKPKTKMKAEQRIEVFEGMTVKDVQENGSEAQRIVAKAFDKLEKSKEFKEGDGVYSEREAELFNNYRFTLDKENKELRAYNTKTECVTVIKYNNLEELEKHAALIGENNKFKGGQVIYDFRNRTATFDGLSAYHGSLSILSAGMADRVVVKNCSLHSISGFLYHGTLDIKNTKEVGILWNSATKVMLEKDAVIKADEESKIDIRRYEQH